MIKLYEMNEHLKAVVEQTGYECLASLLFLHWLIKNVRPKYVLELGTGYGCSTIFMALANKSVKIISIDDYRGDMARNPIEPYENLMACQVADRVELVNANTKDSLANFWTDINAPEIMFMDASHNDKDLQCEYDAFKDILTPDHIIVIDDICVSSVSRFATRLAKEYEFTSSLDFHNGMSVLATSIDRYSQKIDAAKRSVIND